MNTNYINKVFQTDFYLEPINNSIDWSDWVVLGLCILTLISSRILNFEYLTTFFKKSPDYFSTNKASVLSLVFNFILTSSFFLKQVILAPPLSFSFFKNNNLLIYLTLFLSISALIILKFLTLYLLRILFNTKSNYILYYHLKYYQMMGILILPLFLLSYFLSPEIKTYIYGFSFILYCLLLIRRESEIFFTALKQRVSFLYIILYLCTLEILPLILSIKILIG